MESIALAWVVKRAEESSVSDARRGSWDVHKKWPRWRQRVGDFSIGIQLPTSLASLLSHDHSVSLFTPTLSLPLPSLDYMRAAARYVHFYALIYAHARTKNNPGSKRRRINEHDRPSSSLLLLPLRIFAPDQDVYCLLKPKISSLRKIGLFKNIWWLFLK